jgi:hypothetical protein
MWVSQSLDEVQGRVDGMHHAKKGTYHIDFFLVLAQVVFIGLAAPWRYYKIKVQNF